MIENLHIVNFQSHKDSSLEFAPGVNVIVGDSDCGKTAIIRALRWLVHNKPGGESFRSNWGGETRVEIVTEKGTDIARIKGKENEYQIGGETHRAFGAAVPEVIQEALNLDETNIQFQLDAPFLISSSPGEVSSFFNRIAKLDQIDSGLKNIQANIRSLTNEIQADESRVQELKEDLKEFEYIDWAEIDLEVLEADQELLVKKAQTKNRLGKLIHDAEEVEEQIEESSRIQQFESNVHSLLAEYNKYNRNHLESLGLFRLIHELSEIDKETTKLAGTTQHKSDVDALLKQHSERRDVVEQGQDLQSVILLIENIDTKLANVASTTTALEKRFNKEMPDICPLCNTNLKVN